MSKIVIRDASKVVLRGLLIAGGIAIACTSPYFVTKILPKIVRYARYEYKNKRKKEKCFYNAFFYLKKNGYIRIDNKNGQIYISLTEEGRKKAGKYQIDDLKIKKSKKWDGKWRIMIFDIKDKQKIKREALRGKIKELELFQLQKSVWIYPYDFNKELGLLRSFFGLNKKEMQFILASSIEYDDEAKNYFGLK
jgi:hypothetical protein